MEKAVAAWLLMAASTAGVPSPTEVVQAAVDRVVHVMQDVELARPAASELRRQEMRRIAESLFDFPEMARRTLARHWTDRTSQQREEFVRLFTALMERTYLSKIENYSGEKIVYAGETVDGEFATVRSKIIAGRKGEVPIEYRLHLVGPRWAVYDVLIEGVSFVSTYRSQFNKVIQTSSYNDLVQKLRAKELELTTLDQSGRKTY